MNDNKTIQPMDNKTETDYQPEVSKIAKRGKNQNLFIFLIIALFAVAFLAYSFWNKKDTPPAQVKEKEEFGTKVQSKTFNVRPPEEIPAILKPESQPTTISAQKQEVTESTEEISPPRLLKGQADGTVTSKKQEESPQIASGESSENEGVSKIDSVANQPPEPAKGDMFEDNVSTFKAGKAHKLPVNANLLLAKGTFIQCSLRTKLVSTVAGNLGCVVANDVYSANGTVLLIEKGSTVFGEFRNGQIQQGEERLFVVWSEIRTPKNIIININSGATDELGGTGIPGYVDNHFWERFGNAIMLSMITDSTSALSTQLAKRGTFNPTDTVQAGSEIAQSILEKTINIPPTLYKNQGDLVGIFVARDIDFGDVYELKQK